VSDESNTQSHHHLVSHRTPSAPQLATPDPELRHGVIQRRATESSEPSGQGGQGAVTDVAAVVVVVVAKVVRAAKVASLAPDPNFDTP